MVLMLKLVFFVMFGCLCYIVTVTTDETDWTNRFNISSNNHKHIDAIFQRCTGSCNKKYCKIYSSCRPFNRTSKIKRLDVYFHEGVKLEEPIFLEVSAFKKFRTQYRPHMLKYKEEVCKILLMKSNPIFAFLGLSNSTGNLLDPCPLIGHKYENPKITSTWVGTLVPTGDWRLDFILTKVIDGREEPILTISYYILVKGKDAIGADEF